MRKDRAAATLLMDLVVPVAGYYLLRTAGLGRGRHTLVLQVSDYQESRNMENVGPILGNTRTLRARFVVR